MSLQSVLPKGTKLITSAPLPGSTKKHILSPDSSSGENLPLSLSAPSASTSTPSPLAAPFVHLVFPAGEAPQASHLALTFQGGFVGTSVNVWVGEEIDSEREGEVELGLELGGRIYPEDKNRRQIFEIPFPPTVASTGDGVVPVKTSKPVPQIREIKLEFEKSSDHYGRITLYSLELLA
ncbi:hypothetical protein B9479_004645 [Cryptococcus floricola]|uniref:SUN domain-containing protein n=1 Tax=Cryptococcus floricola TaxID=2591691 RepID=A0A5D3ATF3_9TREE|nr:hypothetical protein B9479_004645 [Cryptococcus floricola]